MDHANGLMIQVAITRDEQRIYVKDQNPYRI